MDKQNCLRKCEYKVPILDTVIKTISLCWYSRSGAGPMSDQYVDAVGQVPGQLQLVDQSRCRLQVRKWLPVGTGTRRQLLALERYRRGEYDLPSRVQLYVDAGRACVTTSLQPVDVPRRILRRRRLSLWTRFDNHCYNMVLNKQRIRFGIWAAAYLKLLFPKYSLL